jgi:hypothetical protein
MSQCRICYTVSVRYPREYRSGPEAIASQVRIPVGGLKIMKVKIGPMVFADRSLGAAALAGVLAAGLTALPSAAKAGCDIPKNGVPEETLPAPRVRQVRH